uniref:Superoxide dismutase [Cu-Zn] n=1 Tax=Euplotes focardii TaxID=36767 RepID=W0FUJ3_EUPFO|nr:CuZn superoxide dismutase 2 [Euplotes focardii]|mmetsp:Transcript_9962/g.11311  ORF Transcript_9962/g.11311 Transcript_9962/m.11311 type:complete len:163 (-) Transcript_9962:64-552(-)
MEATAAYALCILRPDGGSSVNGVVRFIQQAGGKTRVIAEITGLPAGLHGFHVHKFGNLIEGCKTAGPHFNPHGKEHGGPLSEERHVGDMGNVDAGEDGVAKLDYEDAQIELIGEHSIIGRSVVCHAGTDDHGEGGHDDSKTTGHAGARLACGTIGLSDTFDV